MNEIDRRLLLKFLASTPLAGALSAARASVRPQKPGICMYMNMHWPRKYPYCARSWTVEDWDGYADGLKKLGFDSFSIWPMFETIPDPATPSDQEWVQRLATVTRRLQSSHGMRVELLVVPNATVSEEARNYRFEERPFFNICRLVDPSDPQAMRAYLERREELLRPLAHVDVVGLCDSDPSGYPGATNAQFIDMLLEHRKMLDRLRPGLEFDYYMFLGWSAGSATSVGGISWEDYGAARRDADFQEVLRALRKADPEPWGLWKITVHPRQLSGRDLTLTFGEDRLGLGSRVRGEMPYGAVEQDPSFPMTNFGDRDAFEAGARRGAYGVAAVPQVHQLQLPNIFAFAQGAKGGTLSRSKYVEFAGRLIAGQGEAIVRAWEALSGRDAQNMRGAAMPVGELHNRKLVPGDLRGLLLGGGASGFLHDLRLQLELKATALDLIDSVKREGKGRGALAPFVEALGAWQRQHGYSGNWTWDYRWDSTDIDQALQQLDIAGLDAVFNPVITGATPMERWRNRRWAGETQTKRLVKVLEKHVARS